MRRLLVVLIAALGVAAPAFAQGQTVTKAGTTAPYAVGVQGATGGLAFHTICDSGCGGAATFADNAAFTAGSTSVTNIGGVFNDSITDLTSGSAGAPRLTSKRAIHFNLRTNAGVEVPFPAALDADLGFKVHVQNTVTVTDTHTTAAVPLSLRLSDGAAFYDAAKTGQLPSALVGGRLDVNVGAALPAGTNLLGKVGLDQTTPGTTNAVSIAQIGATTVVNGGLAGSLAVGGTAGNNAAITQNPLVIGLEARSSTPTAATNGNQIRSAGDLAGNQFGVFPIAWSCELDNIAATLTECKAVPSAGYSLYVTSVIAISTTATAGTFSLRQGTGANCGTGTDNVLPGGAGTARTYFLPGNGALPFTFNSPSGIKLTAANALCGIGVATNTLNVVVSGFTAP